MNLGWVFLCFCIGFLYLLTLGCFFGVVEDRPFLFERRSLFFPVTFVDFESFFGTIFQGVDMWKPGPGAPGIWSKRPVFPIESGESGTTLPGDFKPLYRLRGATLSKIVPRRAAKTQENGQVLPGGFFF